MGSGEDTATPLKSSKQAASTQETPTTSAYQDWSTSMQAYYGAGGTPPAFFTSTVPSSPTPHPYLYPPFLPPYGTPVPYIYPHGGPYTHPYMALAQSAAPVPTETEGNVLNGKDQGAKKKSKRSSGNTDTAGGKSGDTGKAASGSGNDCGASQSAESGNEASSHGSAENTNQTEATIKRSIHQFPVDGAAAQNNAIEYSGAAIESSCVRGQPAGNPPVSAPGKPSTQLNIGMDIWNASSASVVPLKTFQSNASGVSPSIPPTTVVGCEGVVSDHRWIQDEREMKRQRRKQSNRESARRSRLRKQAECEELQNKVERLSSENHLLKKELTRLSEECLRLSKDNESIMEELKQVYGPEAVAGFEVGPAQPVNEENNVKCDDSREGDLVSDEDGNCFKSNGDLEPDPN